MSSLAFRRGPVDPVQVWKDTVIYSTFAFVCFIGVYLWLVKWGGPLPIDGSGMVVGKDFFNVWTMGREALSDNPGKFYNIDLYRAEIQRFFGADYPQPNWSYPPVTMLAALPFGQMPYLAALALFMATTLAVFLAVATWRSSGWKFAAILAMSPAAIICFNSGQFAFLLTALVLAIFALMDKRPVLAGALVGLMAIKPHLVVFMPLLLAFSGRWIMFASAAVVTLCLAGLSVALFGTQAWLDYINLGLPVQKSVLTDPEMLGAITMPTIYMNMRQFHLPYEAAMAVQVVAGIIAAVAVCWVARTRRAADPDLLLAFFLACTTFGLPYILSYDTLPLTFAAAWLLVRGKLDSTGVRIALLVWWLPLLQMGFGAVRIPGPGLIVAPLFAWWLFQRLRASEAQAPVPPAQVQGA